MKFTSIKKVIMAGVLASLLIPAMAQESEEIDSPNKLSRSNQEYTLTVDQAIRALHAQNYEKSFRLLQKGSQFGNKQSQFFLAMSYFNGWGTEVNNKLGWLWINVALEARNAQWKHSFKKVSEAIPEDIQEQWAADVIAHKSQYGAKATGHICRRHRPTGSSIVEIVCDREYDGS